MKKNVVLSLSGGMDSSTLLLKCLTEYENVVCLSFDYGQKHSVELEKAKELVGYLNDPQNRISSHSDHVPDGFEYKYNKIQHHTIKIDGLQNLLYSTLVKGNDEVPEGHYQEETMSQTVVPNRNKIFSSIIQAVALSISDESGENCDIALGIHAGDHCFSKNTNILTPNGLKNILELKEGDEVFSFNLKSNEWEIDLVTHIVKKNLVKNLSKITTTAGELEVTEEHKVFKLGLSNLY
jgi:7-cyano-7-deazaguanine synthase in queuosine biosynthesis